MPPPSSPRFPRSPRLSLAVMLGIILASLSLAPTVGANESTQAASPPFDPSAIAPPSPELPDLPSISVELAKVSVSSPAFDQAAKAYAEVAVTHATAQRTRTAVDASATTARVEGYRLQGERSAAVARVDGLTRRLDALDAAIRDIAIGAFVSGRNTERMAEALTSPTPAINETDQRAVLGQLSMDVLLAEQQRYRTEIAAAQQRVDKTTTALSATEAVTLTAHLQRTGASKDEVTAGGQVADARVPYEQARVLATVKGVEFPLVALDAYYRAAATENVSRPGCRVQWWGVAGIAKVEGRHGTYGGASLGPNGDVSRPIIGIQLDGSRSTAVITDSDNGDFDGDPNFDRAVGPMQFIPSTWRAYQADGNRDGVMSPFNMYDATLAAARYLCTGQRDLTADAGLRQAYFSYNHSQPYVERVLGYARGYEQQLAVPTPFR